MSRDKLDALHGVAHEDREPIQQRRAREIITLSKAIKYHKDNGEKIIEDKIAELDQKREVLLKKQSESFARTDKIFSVEKKNKN